MEKWESVIGYEGLYEVSNYGRVRNALNGHILKPALKRNGYLTVDLANGMPKKTISIHRLVASAFVENPNGFNTVNHMDENKLNNRAENLEWCTPKYNRNYGSAKYSCFRPINQLSYDGAFIKRWDSLKYAAEFNGIKYQGISDCCRGKRKHCGGFMWEYA